MSNNAIKNIIPLDFQWKTLDPFLFCVHHQDYYPAGNSQFGPDASLAGRQIGQDFVVKDGWRMYHGDKIPGFPVHPHRGFETITIVTKGFVDHADSLGAAGRYGGGDVQWMTAGKGVQHSEMFPLIHRDKSNDLELFQIWLNLPKRNKMVEPHFSMLWREHIPSYSSKDNQGNLINVTIIAGELGQQKALSPPPDSWAADINNHVEIWLIKLQANAKWTMPSTIADANRMLYFYVGDALRIAGKEIKKKHGIQLQGNAEVLIENGVESSGLLLLQARPINEAVAQYGPFVMNTNAEIQQAFVDYRATQFGGWPWPHADQVHGERGRFAKHANGVIEEP